MREQNTNASQRARDPGMLTFLQAMWKGDVNLDRLLEQAIKRNDLPAARTALDAGAKVNGTGATDPLLCVAIEREAYDVALLLIERGADPNLPSCEDHVTPMHLACRQGWVAGIDALVARGAQINTANALGLRPVDMAIGTDNFDKTVDRMLAHGVDINGLNEQGQSLLHLALYQVSGPKASAAAAWLLANDADACLPERRHQPAGDQQAARSLTPIEIIQSRGPVHWERDLDWFSGAVDAQKALRFMQQIKRAAGIHAAPA